MDKSIKKCVDALCREEVTEIQYFGRLIEPIIFVTNKMALGLNHKDGIFTIFLQDKKEFQEAQRKAFLKLTELVAVIKKLEKEGLIYVQVDDDPDDTIFYQCVDVATRSRILVSDGNLNDGKHSLKALSYENKQLCCDLSRYLCAFIFPTNDLIEFVKHKYRNETEFISFSALSLSCWSLWVAFVVAIVSVVGSTLCGNCFGYTKIEKGQYCNIIKGIQSKDTIIQKIQVEQIKLAPQTNVIDEK